MNMFEFFGTWHVVAMFPHLYKVICNDFKIAMKMIKHFSRKKCDLKYIDLKV